MVDSLWGEEFNLVEVDPKKLIKKVSNPKNIVKTVDQLLKSKNISKAEKMALIRENVKRILGKFAERTLVIRDKETLVKYFDKAIENGIIAVDTETNNSLQPITCKLAGPCFYTPGMKQVYVPINHINFETGELLPNQLTEDDIAEQLQRLLDNKTKVLMHNSKFDRNVLKCTTGIVLEVYWDTLLGARILNENEEAKLKTQYITHIDPSIEKYSIDHLFAGVEYIEVDPDTFALYAATDSFMTYELFKYQEELFALPENASIFKIFRDVEMAVMPATAEMELTGLEIDKDYIAKLGKKYHEKLDEIDKRILLELESHTDTIKKWRQTPKANVKPRTYLFSTKHGESEEAKKLKPGDVLKGYPLNDNDGKGPYKAGKSPNELLEDPINLGSPAQLAILLYDIMKVEPPNPKKPRGTGKEELEAIKLPICELLLERRGLAKLIDAFIDSLPNEIIEKTGRVHANFNQYGADTGRYSCSNPNMQQIPAKNKEIRLIFKASTKYDDVEVKNNRCIINKEQDVETKNGWLNIKNIEVGMFIYGDAGLVQIKHIEETPTVRILYFDYDI